MTRYSRQVATRLKPEVFEEFKLACESHQAPMSEVIRNLIEDFLTANTEVLYE